MLSESESDGEGLHQLTVNEHFAKAYAHKKEREELSKLKEKYGSDADGNFEASEDSEEDTTEDEEGEELTPAVDAAILRTLARIKRKDPTIYDTTKSVFEEEQQNVVTNSTSAPTAKKAKEKSRPLLLKEHILQSTLRSSRSPSPGPDKPTHVEEQATLRKETISAFHTAVAGEEESEEDDLLVPREKTKDEIEKEEEEYREFLRTQVGQDISQLVSIEEPTLSVSIGEDQVGDKSEKKGKRKKRTKKDGRKKEEDDHEFLMNYILNRGWIDREAKRIPTYREVTGMRKRKSGEGIIGGSDVEDEEGGNDGNGSIDLIEEDEFDDIADTFESSYNFRFEEPDAATIPTHPRNIASTVRREDNPRKAARERKKARQEEKLLQKKEEVKRLKALKMKEIREKLERVGREGGKSVDDEAFAQLDLEGDWDPDAHDRQMAGIYGEDDDAGDLEKPTWDDDIDVTDIVPPEPEPTKKKKKDKKKKKSEDIDDDGVDVDDMDADALEGTSSKGKKRKLDDEDLDEVYALDFNSMVGDMPTRFKYMPVLPQTYGLSAEELLLADDRDLNEYVGLRRVAAPYRKDKGRTWDAQRAEKLQELRKKLGERKGNATDGEARAGDAKKKRKGKKERQKEKLLAVPADTAQDDDGGDISHTKDGAHDVNADETRPSKKRKRKHKKSSRTTEAD